MGVHGLTSLLDSDDRIYRQVQFRGRRLVIDGCNLLYHIYFNSGLDQNRGGDYAALEERIEKFVSVLRDCDVTAYWVMDGGSDPSDKKLETALLRVQDRIQRVHRAALEDSDMHIIPTLAALVLTQTLRRLDVPLVQCYAEADQEIAALASEWRCPVLSNDSDFFIFSLPAGMLPVAHFKWEEPQKSRTGSFIPCKSCSSSSVCVFFNVKPRLLPVFAALAGNDYVKLQTMGLSVKWSQFDPAFGEKPPRRLTGLLTWLRGFQRPEEAMEAALGLMGDLSSKRKAEVLQRLTLGLEEYRLPPSSLKDFFSRGTAPPFAQPVAALVPDWMRLPLTQAQLTYDVLDVLQLQRKILWIHVDDSSAASANLTSRSLRQVTYALLLQPGTRRRVEELDREGLLLKTTMVQPACRGRCPALHSLNKVALSLRLQVLLEALNVTEASLSRLPPQLRLPVAVTCFWLQGAEPPPDETLLRAVLLWLSNGDALRGGASAAPEHQPQKLDVNVVHSLNQWQACLKDAIKLNQLLQRPLPEPQVSRLYEGTFVHQLVHRMRTGTGKVNGHHLYESMLSVVHGYRSQEASTSSASSPTPPPSPPSPSQTEDGDAVSLQEDAFVDGRLSLKTRYKTKKRNECKNPEVVRKQDYRGGGGGGTSSRASV